MKTELAAVEEKEYQPNDPSKKDWENAGYFGGVAIIATGTWWLADKATVEAIKAATKDKTGTEAVKAARDTYAVSAVVKVGGGAAVGIGGRFAFDGEAAAAITDGIGVGLIGSGLFDVERAWTANKALKAMQAVAFSGR